MGFRVKKLLTELINAEEHGYTGSERSIRGLVSSIRNQPLASATLPLQFDPGMDAQVDFWESYADVAGADPIFIKGSD